MTKRLEIYKCEICGNIVEVLHAGAGQLVCCGKPMKLLKERLEEAGLQEKHVPVVEKKDGGIKVKVGSIPHPMEEKHFIEWVQVVTKDGAIRKFLKPGVNPEAEFDCIDAIVSVREYCNVHGLWLKLV